VESKCLRQSRLEVGHCQVAKSRSHDSAVGMEAGSILVDHEDLGEG